MFLKLYIQIRPTVLLCFNISVKYNAFLLCYLLKIPAHNNSFLQAEIKINLHPFLLRYNPECLYLA